MHTTTTFHPGAFNLHTTGLTGPRETPRPLEALIEPRVYGLSWLSVLGQAVLGVLVTLTLTLFGFLAG